MRGGPAGRRRGAGECVEDYLVEIPVPCLRVQELLSREGLAPERVVAVIIDTQGFDGTIVRSILCGNRRLSAAPSRARSMRLDGASSTGVEGSP